MANTTEDPRTTGEHVRRLPGEGGSGAVTLVGVVHNHPASTYRVRAVLDAADPDAVALELPPLSIPLYEEYADDVRTPPSLGGEMSAAVQAATTDRVVGIDGPDPGFVARLARTLATDRASLSTASTALESLLSATKRAVTCRLAARLARTAGVRLEVDAPVGHECERADDPAAQASDERAQVRQARAIADSFEQPAATRIRDRARNQHMASHLATLRQEGDVTAVVGIAHLGPLSERLAERQTQ